MINIAFISNYFGIGGIERTFLSIAENLSGKGYSFHFINLAEKKFQNRFWKCGGCFHSANLSDIIKYLIDNKIDIVQTCNCDDGSYLAYLAGIKNIIERPDGFSSAFLSDKTPVSSIICSTDKVYKKAKLLFPKKYIKKIYNGVDTAVFYNSGKDEALSRQLNLKPENTVIGYCGRIAKQKCLHNLIDVFANINGKFPKTRLIILGEEFPKKCGYQKELADKTKKLNLENKILFCGAAEYPEKFISLFDISVLCSGSHKLSDGNFEVEGIPNAIMESMAMGIPTAAASSGETDLLVKNNINGFLNNVDEWDKFQKNIEILINDPDLRRKMGSAAQQHIHKNFKLTAMVNKYDELYRFSITPDFSTKYPDVSKKMKSHFLYNEFIHSDSKENKSKKILVIKSGSDFLFNFLMEDINKLFDNPDISILTTQAGIKKLSTTGYGAKTFVYHKSKKFSVENMDEIIKKLNKENFNYLFFLFNDLQGKNYGNIKNLVSQINADNKIVMNKLLKKFIFS